MTTPDITTRLRESAEAFRKHPVFTADGDPAFLTVQADECTAAADEIDRLRLGHNGMDLRDWFAGKAVVGILSNSENVHAGAEPTNSALSCSPESFSSWVARVSYLVADAMLAHRSPSQIEEGNNG